MSEPDPAETRSESHFWTLLLASILAIAAVFGTNFSSAIKPLVFLVLLLSINSVMALFKAVFHSPAAKWTLLAAVWAILIAVVALGMILRSASELLMPNRYGW